MSDFSHATPRPWLREGKFVYALHIPRDPFYRNGKAQPSNRFSANFQADSQGAPDNELEDNAALSIEAVNKYPLLERMAERLRRTVELFDLAANWELLTAEQGDDIEAARAILKEYEKGEK